MQLVLVKARQVIASLFIAAYPDKLSIVHVAETYVVQKPYRFTFFFALTKLKNQ